MSLLSASAGSSAITAIDADLLAWAREVAPDADAWLGLPEPAGPDGAARNGVAIYLFELGPMPVRGGPGRPPLQAALRYLIATESAEPEQAHTWLGNLVLSALDTPGVEVDLEPIAPGTWAALGLRPRPAFVLTVPLRRERPTVTKLVTVPPIVKHVPVSRLHGRVLGPSDTPLPGVRVELPALRRSTRTDDGGRFAFGSVPAENVVPLQVVVRAKGRFFAVDATTSVGTDDGLLIRLE